jgi:hypothetical protein
VSHQWIRHLVLFVFDTEINRCFKSNLNKKFNVFKN